MIIHLIRHGDTEGTERHLYYGKTDLPLSPQGRERLSQQAARGGYPSLEGFDLYSTGMVRTEETLSILYGDAPHSTLPLLREINLGIFEMESHESLKDRADYQQWISGKFLENVPPEGESLAIFSARITAGLEELLAKGKNATVVCHGGTISAIMHHFFPREGKRTYDWIPNPGHGYRIELGEENRTYIPIPNPHWMGKEYSFFQHTACEYFPCHGTDSPETFNCLFCYCPLYALGEKCGGDFRYTQEGVKDCSHCTVPHQKDNYGRILSQMTRLQKLAKVKKPEKTTD